MSEYIVDLSKPPIGPPERILREECFMLVETKESVQRNKDYHIYIEKYKIALEIRRKYYKVVYFGNEGSMYWVKKEPTVEYDEFGWEIVSRKKVKIISIIEEIYNDNSSHIIEHNTKILNIIPPKYTLEFFGMGDLKLEVDEIKLTNALLEVILIEKRVLKEPNGRWYDEKYTTKYEIDWNV